MTTVTTLRLNGFPVIHRAPHRAQLGAAEGLEAVLVYREGDALPFAVASWAPHMGASWHQGDYCATLDEAMEAFTERAQRPSSVDSPPERSGEPSSIRVQLEHGDAITAATALEWQAADSRERAGFAAGTAPAREREHHRLADDLERIARAIRRAIGEARA